MSWWRCVGGLLLFSTSVYGVIPVAVGSLLRKKAHYFDLEQKRVRFVPKRDGYQVSVVASGAIERGDAIGKPTDPQSYSWRTKLPFPFAFGGKKWDEVYINLNGNLSFGEPETKAYPERETWPDGTMHSLASALDVGAIRGERRMIVPLWGLNSAEGTQIFTKATRSAFVVTWQAVRYQAPNEAYEPLGDSLFQVRLQRDGVIEFRYGKVAEKDGVTGIFYGKPGAGKLLDAVDMPPSKASPEHDLRRAEVRDTGADLHFSMTLAAPLPSTHRSGRIVYGMVAMSAGEAQILRVNVEPSGVKPGTYCVVINPSDHPTGTDCPGSSTIVTGDRRIDFYVPKILLKDAGRVEWRAEIVVEPGEGPVSSTGELRAVTLARTMASGFDLSGGAGPTSGNLYEVFHYPFLSKARHPTFHEIYRRVPAEADLAIAATDFRIDDIHNHGASNSSNGGREDRMEAYHSPLLLQVAGPVFLGPRFREVVQYEGRTFRSYPFATTWAAHEMTHHWVATLQWKEPYPLALVDTVQSYHWSPFLNVPAVTPVWALFTDSAYPQESVMGGMTVIQKPDGTSEGGKAPWGAPTGLSALDLYSMGLIGPEEVPETFVIAGAVKQPDGSYKGGNSVPVTIAEIEAVNGPRTPPAKEAQHTFRFAIYLLHEDGRAADPAKMAQARGIEESVARYFEKATNGRMKIVVGNF